MYQERASRLAGAVLWSRTPTPSRAARVLPDGCMDLLLHNGELVVAGPDTRAHVVAERAGDRFTGLRFAPGTGPLIFGVPAHELRDQRVPLGAVWPEHEVRLLAERAAGARDVGRALEDIAAPVPAGTGTHRPGRWAPQADAVPRAVVAMLRGGAAVAEVAGAVGLSERQLRRRCLDAFGYGPKTLARVLRMRHALRLAGSGTALAEVALAAGYADQAHLSREVRALAGVPVTTLVRPGAPG